MFRRLANSSAFSAWSSLMGRSARGGESYRNGRNHSLLGDVRKVKLGVGVLLEEIIQAVLGA